MSKVKILIGMISFFLQGAYVFAGNKTFTVSTDNKTNTHNALDSSTSRDCNLETKNPVSELESEIGGKLFFVHTLPELSDDGTLIATYNPKGIRIEKTMRHWEQDETGRLREVLTGDRLTTLHFTINNHVLAYDYVNRPFVVIIPLNQPSEYDILKLVVSASFSEVVVIGDYKLPPNAIIMVRESESKKLPKYYEQQGFNIEKFDDAGENEKPNFIKKIAAVRKVILKHQGLQVDTPSDDVSWLAMHVKDQKGRELNTIDFFKRLIPHGPVAFGIDEFTYPASQAEQWRMAYIRSNSVIYHGDVGFSIEGYQSQKLTEWLEKFKLPKEAIENHKKVNRENLIAFRAMDYIFDHFQNKKLAYDYIEAHLKNLEQQGLFKRVFVEKQFKGKSIDELAKVICDYDYLKSQKPVILSSSKGLSEYRPKFDLVDKKTLIERIFFSAVAMQPNEASEFFKEFSLKSTIFTGFSEKEQEEIRQTLLNMYVLTYANGHFTSKEMVDHYKSALASMVDKNFKIQADDDFLVIRAFFLINDNDISSKPEELQKTTVEKMRVILQGKFDETVLFLQQPVGTASINDK